jgi:hypothetical protein
MAALPNAIFGQLQHQLLQEQSQLFYKISLLKSALM